LLKKFENLFPKGNWPSNNSKQKPVPPPYFHPSTRFNDRGEVQMQGQGPQQNRYIFQLKQGLVFSKRPEILVATLRASGPQCGFDIESAPDGTTKIRMQNYNFVGFLEEQAAKLYYRAPGARKFIVN
jgi:hypothetical protein